MSTTNIPTHQTPTGTPQRTPEQPVYCVTLFVEPDTIVTANPTGLRLGTITNGYVSIIANPNSRDDNPETVFDTLDSFLHRCLTAVEQGRTRHAIDQAKQLPCGGVCRPDTWPAGVWACSSVDQHVGCMRHEGHDGDHVACADVAGEHVIRHTWPQQQVA